jgi:rfaE bifunctional protein nucleotidyltransferase chain/domain
VEPDTTIEPTQFGAEPLVLPQLQSLVKHWHAEDLRVGFTCGAFDLLHAGHVHYLKRARSLCDRLIVAVNSDRSVRSYKDPLRPIVPERHRMSVVAALSCVDAVTLLDDDRPSTLLKLLKPEIYIKGGDYSIHQLNSAPIVHEYGGKCEIVPIEHEISSSAIVGRIQELSLYAAPEKGNGGANGRIAFLDRDGTLIRKKHFLNDPEKVELLPGVGQGLRALQDQGFRLVVITNQQGLGLGYFDYDAFVAVNSAMLRQLARFGVVISKFYFCPHSLADHCDCRKPASKLIENGLRDFYSRASDCVVIGDMPGDAAAAEKAGCKSILITDQGAHAMANNEVRTFAEAVELVLKGRIG